MDHEMRAYHEELKMSNIFHMIRRSGYRTKTYLTIFFDFFDPRTMQECSSTLHTPRSSRRNSGFTLLEMIVSMGIFSIVMLMSVSVVIMAQNAQVKARNMQNVQDNVRFVLEFMNKELRTGLRLSVC